jgi:1,4-alpha-glucan branching enzyme
MQRIIINVVVLLFICISLTGCGPGRLGPEERLEGVYFPFYAPEARSIAIAGSFNQWDFSKDILIGPDKHGVWSIILPLPAGRYEYLFVVNGKEWKLDPGAPPVDDGLGGRNSVVVIGE